MQNNREAARALSELTSKQRAVLDLLVAHKTSKEIARLLGISPHTVDQRIAAARRKFGVETRNELAGVYAEISGRFSQSPVYEKPVYQFPQLSNAAGSKQSFGGTDEKDVLVGNHPEARHLESDEVEQIRYRVVPEIFEGPQGYFWRFAAIIALALLMSTTVLIGFAIFDQLSRLLN